MGLAGHRIFGILAAMRGPAIWKDVSLGVNGWIPDHAVNVGGLG